MMVVEAWKRVKANQGAAGVDKESIADFERHLKDNLYRIWNRMSSGSYVCLHGQDGSDTEETVKGGETDAGPPRFPTVADRVAQMVVNLHFEPNGRTTLSRDSYGYRPNKSAIQSSLV